MLPFSRPRGNAIWTPHRGSCSSADLDDNATTSNDRTRPGGRDTTRHHTAPRRTDKAGHDPGTLWFALIKCKASRESVLAIETTPRAYLFIAVPVVFALSAMGALALFSTFVLGHGSVYGLVPLFLLNAEANIPTFFSALNLILCGLLLLLIATFTARTGGRFVASWVLLGLGALFVGVDEAAQIHELLDANPQWTLGMMRKEDSPFVVVYGLLTLGLAVATFRLFLRLPTRYKVLFTSTAVLYVGGALGLELVGARELTTAGATWYYEVVNGMEEVLEMAAVTLLNASLLGYIRSMHGPLTISAQ